MTVVYSECTLKHAKEFNKLSKDDKVEWKELSKESKEIYKKCSKEHTKVIMDQAELFLKWRNEQIHDRSFKRLTEDEVSMINEQFNVRTTAIADLANMACYLGCTEALRTTRPDVTDIVNENTITGNNAMTTDKHGNRKQKCDYSVIQIPKLILFK